MYRERGVEISIVESSRVADVLRKALYSNGIIDDWNEIVIDMKDTMSDKDILDYAKSVQVSLIFLNTFDISGEPKIVKDFYQEALALLNETEKAV
jgi:hypothetical protein